MAFPTGWTSYRIQSDPTKVSGSSNLTDFPVLIKDGNLSSAVYAGLNHLDYSLDLELSSTQYASISDASQTGLDITGDITIEAWIKLEQLPSTAGSDFTIAGKYLTTGDQRSYWVNIENGSSGTANGLNIYYSSDGGFTNLTRLQTTSAFVSSGDIGSWVHLAIAVDVSAKTMTVYKNGVSQATGSVSTGASSIYNGTGAFAIGSRSGGADYFDGKITSVRIWSDIRTITEVQDNMYNNGLTPGADNLVDVWNLNNSYASESGNNTLTSIGSPVFSLDNPIKATDLRITTDSAGTTEVPFEIVSLNSSAETSEIWAKVPTLSYNSATSLYIWYGNSSALPYSATDTYGSQNVWSDYEGVYHLTGNFFDSTANGYNLTENNTPTDATGKIGNSKSFDSASSEYAINSSPTNMRSNGDKTAQFWLYLDSLPTGINLQTPEGLYNSGGGRFFTEVNSSGNLLARSNGWTTGGSVTSSNSISTGSFAFVAHRISSTNHAIFLNNTKTESGLTGTEESHTTSQYALGRPGTFAGQYLDGRIDEVRFRTSAVSDDWLATEYNNQNDPSTFWTAVTTSIKSINSVSYANIKNINGLAISSIKSVNGVV